MIPVNSFTALLLAVLFAVTSCATGISEQVRSQVTFAGSFAELKAAPQRFHNETALLGGKIIEVGVADQVTEIIVLQLPLNRREQPVDKDQSQGRFIVRSSQFLDPAIYAAGTLVTVVGRVSAGQIRAIGQMDYLYPVLDLVELKKWSAQELQSPRFHFGVGVGTHFD